MSLLSVYLVKSFFFTFFYAKSIKSFLTEVAYAEYSSCMLNIQVFWPYLYLFFKKGKKEFFLDFLIGHYWLNLVLSCDSTSKRKQKILVLYAPCESLCF